jgi:hypothetical protein
MDTEKKMEVQGEGPQGLVMGQLAENLNSLSGAAPAETTSAGAQARLGISPRPWRILPRIGYTFCEATSADRGDEGEIITFWSMGGKVPALANAHFAINAVNNYDDLVAALKEAPVHRLGEPLEAFLERYKHWFRNVRAGVLAKAGV